MEKIVKDYDQYKNDDGTYTSPINGKVYKLRSSFRSHICRLNKSECKYCHGWFHDSEIQKHVKQCAESIDSPQCTKDGCDNNVPKSKKLGQTWAKYCSHKCSVDSQIINQSTLYKRTCFEHHEKKCVVCGEDKIVAVHHYDESKDNNNPENLIPLCPTHHAYIHSRYSNIVKETIEQYRKQWLKEHKKNKKKKL